MFIFTLYFDRRSLYLNNHFIICLSADNFIIRVFCSCGGNAIVARQRSGSSSSPVSVVKDVNVVLRG